MWKLCCQTLATEAVAAANQFLFVFLLLPTLLSPIARGNIIFFSLIYLHTSSQIFLISLFGVMSVQGRRALFMKLVWMGRKLLSRNQYCPLLKTLINSTRSCNFYGLHFYHSVFVFSLLLINVQNLNGFVIRFSSICLEVVKGVFSSDDDIDNAAR